MGDHEDSVSIGGRLITNFRFADDFRFIVNAEDEEEAGVLVAVSIQPPQGTTWRSAQTRQK